jgi:hypothetical protein
MATMELMDTDLKRDVLTQRIVGIDDPGVLDAFLTLTDKYYKPKPLTAEQLEDFEIGRRQIAAGQTISHEDVMKKFDAMYPDDED